MADEFIFGVELSQCFPPERLETCACLRASRKWLRHWGSVFAVKARRLLFVSRSGLSGHSVMGFENLQCSDRQYLLEKTQVLLLAIESRDLLKFPKIVRRKHSYQICEHVES
jgi:hypothetical protein